MNSATILLVGSGGREHALAWKLAQSSSVKKIYVAPGNAGTQSEAKCENVALSTVSELAQFASKNNIDLTVVGPEALLVEGIADEFAKQNLPIFAPNLQSAQLEGSKAFAKEFMQKYGVKTASFANFSNQEEALNHLETINYPTVVKASGLAAGKGVIICQNKQEAQEAVQQIMQDNKFGEAGTEIVIEDFLQGFEASILTICDGKTILPFISAKDHKKIGEGETGLNTGGMGVVAPNPQLTEAQYQSFITDILEPTLKGIQAENMDFVGVIFFGLMVTANGVYCLEYNVRFGDPETQAVLPLLESDLYDLLLSATKQELNSVQLQWKKEHSCCVVAVSGGYPEQYQKGKEITMNGGLANSQLFIAGAKHENDKLLTSGGRVLNVVALGNTLQQAQEFAYADIQQISFEGINYRSDIGNTDQ